MSAALSYPVSALKPIARSRAKILILEPDLAVLDYLRLTLGSQYSLNLFSEEQALLDRLEKSEQPDLLLLALHTSRDVARDGIVDADAGLVARDRRELRGGSPSRDHAARPSTTVRSLEDSAWCNECESKAGEDRGWYAGRAEADRAARPFPGDRAKLVPLKRD